MPIKNTKRTSRFLMSKSGRPYVLVKMWFDRDARIHASVPQIESLPPTSREVKFHGSFARGENWLADLIEELCLLIPTMKDGDKEPD